MFFIHYFENNKGRVTFSTIIHTIMNRLSWNFNNSVFWKLVSTYSTWGEFKKFSTICVLDRNCLERLKITENLTNICHLCLVKNIWSDYMQRLQLSKLYLYINTKCRIYVYHFRLQSKHLQSNLTLYRTESVRKQYSVILLLAANENCKMLSKHKIAFFPVIISFIVQYVY